MSLLRNCVIFLLLVTGASALVTIVIKCGAKMAGMVEPNKFMAVLGVLLCLFNFSWFIAGNVWVFGSWSGYNPDASGLHTAYCDPTTYMFSFVVLILVWLAIPIGCILACVCGPVVLACLGISSK